MKFFSAGLMPSSETVLSNMAKDVFLNGGGQHPTVLHTILELL